jgi:nitrogen regulatory protein P-II 1
VKGEAMKKLEAIVKPSKMEEVKNALVRIGIRRMKISRVVGAGSLKGHKEVYRGDEYMIDLVKQFKIELVVTTDEMLSQVVEAIKAATKPEGVADEEIFVWPVEEVIPVRKDERRKDAI